MAVTRARVSWTGFTGGPGVNTLHFGVTPDQDATVGDAILARLRVFYESMAGIIPASVSVSFESQLDIIEPEEGRIIDVITATPPAKVQGAGQNGYSSGSGLCVHWLTADYVAGRRVRGRTFMVPLTAAAFDTSGTLNESYRTSVQTAASDLAADESVQLSVLRRGKPPTNLVGTLGGQHRVTAARIADKGAYLTSRRE